TRRNPQERLRLPHPRRRPPRRHHLDRHRHRRDGRPQRSDLPHRLPQRLRPQRFQTPHRPRTRRVPALERHPHRPTRLGAATPTRLADTTHLTASPQQATPPASMPTHDFRILTADEADDEVTEGGHRPTRDGPPPIRHYRPANAAVFERDLYLFDNRSCEREACG